ncbi:hypothetical protein [Arthrobacter sp. MYb213]|uniref:hypothetical protein n=1 Tax=Arthrobacter sp. MYb213 TaxID=1848595 RepID=UPI000CFBB9A7|nr:hypothetical protein [Arthrobacter sp. MYb213]PRB72515.1 hypothetical protein CQ011_02350 [Arthrobacter sp. MYb213]
MSNLPGNPCGTASHVSPHEGENDGDWTIAQATLALAYEQRSANLIALATLTANSNTDYDMETIYKRLGMGPGERVSTRSASMGSVLSAPLRQMPSVA